tara:strand:- start:420 stop:1136 length:717 start_codon:yes stop_codon:yes gene_type:complete
MLRKLQLNINIMETRYNQVLHQIYPFLGKFSKRQGISSQCLTNYLFTGDLWYFNNFMSHYAIDFDDWCRCLHKLSTINQDLLSLRLREIQKLPNHPYKNLITNLGPVVYVCILYWTIPSNTLLNIVYNASQGESKFIDILNVNQVCDINDWLKIQNNPSGYPTKYPDVFIKTFQILKYNEVDLPLNYCCCFPDIFSWSSILQKIKTLNIEKGTKLKQDNLHLDLPLSSILKLITNLEV